MSKIISVSNQKGGVGKTTTALSLSAALGVLEKNVLLIDMDPQANASSGLGIDSNEINLSSYDLIIGKSDPKNLIIKSGSPNLDIVPAKIDLVGLEIEIVNESNREYLLKNSLDKNNHQKAFMNAASPGVINVFMPNRFYKTDDEYLHKLSEIMAIEYETITKSNIQVQLDCPDLALARHMNFKELSEQEFLKRAEIQIECLNEALTNVDVNMTRMHICWGNYEGPHTHDIPLEKILPIILKSKIKYFLIESSNPRHAHEWKVFQDIKLPKDKVLVPGVIDSTSNFVEHPEVVADRLIQFSTVIPKDQLMAGTDCGFSTFAGFGKIDENICYEKLHSLVEGTKLANKVI